jgi:hypothetical protein
MHGIQTYGGRDILGLARHDEVVVGQLRTEDYINNELEGSRRAYWNNLSKTTFHSFWGQFGWMALPMPSRFYRLLLAVTVMLGAGIVLYGRLAGWFGSLSQTQRHLIGLFCLSIGLVFAQFLIYNRTFVQFQGRYLYPALIPLAMAAALGLSGWAGLAAHRLRQARWMFWSTVLAAMSLALLAWVALRDVISLLPRWD